MVKVDWRRKTFRSSSSDGRTMVLSGSSPLWVQGRGGPPGKRGCLNPHQDFTLWCCADQEVTMRASPEGVMGHRLSLMTGDAVRCHMEEGPSLDSAAFCVKLIFPVLLPPCRLLLPQTYKWRELLRFSSLLNIRIFNSFHSDAIKTQLAFSHCTASPLHGSDQSSAGPRFLIKPRRRFFFFLFFFPTSQ